MTVLFYVSGHGYGHATRAAEVVRAGAGRWEAIVCTTAPARLFLSGRVEHAAVDGVVAESPDALRIDAEATRRHWSEFLAGRAAMVEREAAYARQSGASLIVADIPFLAGEIADAAGLPCVGISNFTWNWILEPILAGDMLDQIEAGYERMREYWRLPFSHSDRLAMFPRVIDTPLIVIPPAGGAVSRRGYGRVVFVAFRGQVAPEAFRRAAAESPDTLFLTMDAAAAAGVVNARHVTVTPTHSFQDFTDASDVVIAKLGYGLASACAAGKKRLLYAPRDGFREDEITSLEVARYTAVRPIPLDEFHAGRWRGHIEAILTEPIPVERIRHDGAALCAGRIADLLR